MKSWMDDNQVGDNIQLAIQSQAIQTALEKNNTMLTDGAFQSFLTNAPIPRAWFIPSTNSTLASGVETALNFVEADRTFDPYQMWVSNGLFKLPTDGFYTIQGAVEYQQPVGGGTYVQYAGLKSVSGTYGIGYIVLNQGVATLLAGSSPFQVMHFTAVRPFRAGDTFKVVGFQNSSASELETASSTYGLGIVWNAPWNQYSQVGGN